MNIRVYYSVLHELLLTLCIGRVGIEIEREMVLVIGIPVIYDGLYHDTYCDRIQEVTEV